MYITDAQRGQLIVKLKRELGPTVLEFLNDDATFEIMLNPDSSLWVKRSRSEPIKCL